MMKQVFELLEKIEHTQGNNAKKDIILDIVKNYSDGEEFLRLVFNDVVYGVSKRSFERITGYDPLVHGTYFDEGKLMARFVKTHNIEYNIDTVKEHLNKIEKISGNEQIQYLNRLLQFDKLYAKWVTRALLKDLKTGVSLISVNKCLKDAGKSEIEKFMVQLCGKFETPEDYDLGFPVFAGVKYDGERCIVEKKNGIVKLTSRQGKIIDYVPELVIEFSKEEFGNNFKLDGEILCEDFSTLQKRIGRKVENIEPVKDLHIRVFDILSFGDEDYLRESQSQRKQILSEKLFVSNLVRLEEGLIINTHTELRNYFDNVVDRLYEGIILKLMNRYYDYDSRKNWFKVKPFYEATFKIVNFKFGTGKNSELISKLFVTDKSNKIYSGVGSGLTDSDKEKLMELNSKNQLIGTFIDVMFDHVSRNQDEKYSLRFPRFIKFRFDKIEADDSEEYYIELDKSDSVGFIVRDVPKEKEKDGKVQTDITTFI